MVDLLLLGLMLVMGLAALAGVAGFVLLLVSAGRRSSSPALLEQRIADGWRWVSDEGARLAPWGPESLGQVSDHADVRWSRLLGTGESRSVVPAVADGHRLVVLYGAYGVGNTLQYVAARTAGHRWRLVPQGETWHIGLDGAPSASGSGRRAPCAMRRGNRWAWPTASRRAGTAPTAGTRCAWARGCSARSWPAAGCGAMGHGRRWSGRPPHWTRWASAGCSRSYWSNSRCGCRAALGVGSRWPRHPSRAWLVHAGPLQRVPDTDH